MSEQHRVVSADDVPIDRRHGGELRILLSPKTVGATSGFMGLAMLRPGEGIAEHYHPYTEEFMYMVKGRAVVLIDGEPHDIEAGKALMVPINARHKLLNTSGDEEASLVFHMSPLAPRPELGHVSTEPTPDADQPG